jgi:hypothetical protein
MKSNDLFNFNPVVCLLPALLTQPPLMRMSVHAQ